MNWRRFFIPDCIILGYFLDLNFLSLNPPASKAIDLPRTAKKRRIIKLPPPDSSAIDVEAAEKRKFPCDSCDRVFSAVTSLKYHSDAEHGKVRFCCTVEGCDKVKIA